MSKDDHTQEGQSTKPSFAEAWAKRVEKLPPEQRAEATKVLIRLLRARRTWREMQSILQDIREKSRL